MLMLQNKQVSDFVFKTFWSWRDQSLKDKYCNNSLNLAEVIKIS